MGDVDQNLLYQFGRMGTNDRDDLIKMLQKLLSGRDLDVDTASFFLDMNNWNLQEAICSYLDYETTLNLPSMSLVCDSTIGDGEEITPNTTFYKSWKVQNTGTEAWPFGIVLQGDKFNSFRLINGNEIPIPPLEPKEIREIKVQLISPCEVGMYSERWRMMTITGSYFGDIICWIIKVNENGTLALTQQLYGLTTSQSSDEQMSLI